MADRKITNTRKAMLTLSEVISDETKIKADSSELKMNLDDVFDAGHSVQKDSKTVNSDLSELKDAWSQLQDGMTSEELEIKLQEVRDLLNKARMDADKFRTHASILDVESNDAIGDVIMIKRTTKREIAREAIEIKTMEHNIETQRELLKKAPRPHSSNFDDTMDSFADSLGLGGGGSTPDWVEDFGDAIDPGPKKARENIARLNKSIGRLGAKKRGVSQELEKAQALLPKIENTLGALDDLDQGADDFQEAANTMKADMDDAIRDLDRERKMHNANAVRHFKDKLAKEMEELLAWREAFSDT